MKKQKIYFNKISIQNKLTQEIITNKTLLTLLKEDSILLQNEYPNDINNIEISDIININGMDYFFVDISFIKNGLNSTLYPNNKLERIEHPKQSIQHSILVVSAIDNICLYYASQGIWKLKSFLTKLTKADNCEHKYTSECIPKKDFETLLMNDSVEFIIEEARFQTFSSNVYSEPVKKQLISFIENILPDSKDCHLESMFSLKNEKGSSMTSKQMRELYSNTEFIDLLDKLRVSYKNLNIKDDGNKIKMKKEDTFPNLLEDEKLFNYIDLEIDELSVNFENTKQKLITHLLKFYDNTKI